MTAEAFSGFSLNRRHLLAAGAAAAFAPGHATAQDTLPGADILNDGTPFDRGKLLDYARALAKKPYAAPNAPLPEGFSNLNFEQYSGIRYRRERAVWIENPRGFVVEPLHRGFIYQTPVQVSVVEGGVVRRIVYSPSRYEFGKVQPPPSTAGDIGFSGFRLVVPSPDGQGRDLAVFQGASFVKAVARNQMFGGLARALSLKLGEQRGEEFPFFRAYWIQQPQTDGTIVVHGLLDSDSAAGVFTFTLYVSDLTLIDTEATLFPRVALDNFGVAGMQGTFLFGLGDRRGVDDYRPQVNEVGGLQMLSGSGEWIWRPVSNPKQLQISMFGASNPRGFGLVMRDRDFALYQDIDNRWELHPSIWVEPIGDWGAGALQLVEIPSDNEIHDNIIVNWRPKEPLAAGSEHNFAYRQHWCWLPPERPPLAVVVGTRTGRAGRRRRFVVDFVGERLINPNGTEITPQVWASNNGVQNLRMIPGGDARPYRVIFELDTGTEQLIELRLALMSANSPLSETWLYRWTP